MRMSFNTPATTESAVTSAACRSNFALRPALVQRRDNSTLLL